MNAQAAAYIPLQYQTEKPSHVADKYIPHILDIAFARPGLRVLDVGCGNGYLCSQLVDRGCIVTGVDPSETGVAIARKTNPSARFEVLAGDGNLIENLGAAPFDVVVSSEVIEHVYDPHSFVEGCHNALKPGGRLVLTTPYHGYLKNLAVCLMNGWDRHHKPLKSGGHIKFWSFKTLSALLTSHGFGNIQFRGAGRAPFLWMTMVVSADRM